MKFSAFLALLIVAPTFAATAPAKKDNVNLDNIVTAKAKSKGIKGLLPVTLNGSVDEVTVAFDGYKKSVVCVEFGEAEIPHHPETAPCLKEETRWVPQTKLSAKGLKASVTVGNVVVDAKLGTEMTLAWNCISNLNEVTVVGEAMPASAPTVMTIKSGCTAYASKHIEEKALRPSALKGYSMEAIVDVEVVVPVSSDLELRGDLPATFEVTSPRVEVGSMHDFGGFNTKIFQFFDRLMFNN